MTLPESPTARHLLEAIERSPKTQREIARDAGIARPNFLSMMKTGEAKVPIDRIPLLADALGIPSGPFINTAMHEYHPDLHAVLAAHYGMGLSRSQLLLLEVLDEASHAARIALDPALCDLLVQLLVFAGRLQEEAEGPVL